MHVVSVGQLYSSTKKQWPERTIYNFRNGNHELLMFVSKPAKHEIDAVQFGKMEMAVVSVDSINFFAYRFCSTTNNPKAGIPWSDCPFCWWLVNEHERSLPNAGTESNERSLLRVILVDATTGSVKAIRIVSFPKSVSQEWDKMIQNEAAKTFDVAVYDAALEAVYAKYPDTSSLIKIAEAVGIAGQDQN